MYEDLEGTLLTLKDSRLTQETAEEEAEDTQEKAEDTQEEAEVTQEEAGVTREEAENTQDTLALEQLKRASAQRFSREPPISLPAATLFPEDSVSQEQQSALASPKGREWILPQESVVNPSLSPSNKDPH